MKSLAFRFGAFEYRPGEAALLKQGKPVRVGSRAMSLLGAMLKTPGEYVSHEALMAAAWQDTKVEETNLRVQMNGLRRALGADARGSSLIGNAVGRGYALLSPVQVVELADSPAPDAGKPWMPSGAGGIPRPLTRLVGRERDVADVVARILDGPPVTIVGSGGIGKTRVASTAALAVVAERGSRGLFVDLSSLPPGAGVLGAVASVLEVDDDPTVSLEAKVVEALRARPTVLVLDNCEHVIEAAASLVELTTRWIATLRLVATSREPLRCEGEQVFRLSGLSTPSPGFELSVAAALRYSSIELLVDRARAAHGDFVLDDADLPTLVELCRRLDGIPLAIELAAAQLGALSPRELLDGIDRRIADFVGARRNAPPRHQTLRATLDWSYDTLDAEEARVFGALAVFRAGFSVAMAEAVLRPLEAPVARRLTDLVAKSLVVAETERKHTRLRLLDATKAYAAARFEPSALADSVRLAHASYFADALETLAEGRASSQQRRETYSALIDDVRAAIPWSFGDADQPQVGLRLIVASAPLWVTLSLTHEYVRLIEMAVTSVSARSGGDARRLMVLYVQLHKALFNVAGPVPRVVSFIEGAIPALPDAEEKLVPTYLLFGARLTEGRYEEMVQWAERFVALAEQTDHSFDHAMGHRVLAVAQFRSGRPGLGAEHIVKARVRSDASDSAIDRDLLMYKHIVATSAAHAGIAWLRGSPRDAERLADEAMRLGLEADDIVGLCYGMAHLIVPVALWMNDLDLAEERASQLVEFSLSHALVHWVRWGRAYETAAARLRGRAPSGDFLVQQAGSFEPMLVHTLGTFLDDFADAPSVPSPHWASAEIERRRGNLALARGKTDDARRAFLAARALARSQGARAWELRAATSLAELDGDDPDAAAELRATLEAFDADDGSYDVARARSALAGTRAESPRER